jgi:hypothetical protein
VYVNRVTCTGTYLQPGAHAYVTGDPSISGRSASSTFTVLPRLSVPDTASEAPSTATMHHMKAAEVPAALPTATEEPSGDF